MADDFEMPEALRQPLLEALDRIDAGLAEDNSTENERCLYRQEMERFPALVPYLTPLAPDLPPDIAATEVVAGADPELENLLRHGTVEGRRLSTDEIRTIIRDAAGENPDDPALDSGDGPEPPAP